MSRTALDQPVARPAARPAPVATTVVPSDEPRFATLWATLVYTLVVLVLAYPALTGHFLVNPNSDEYIAGYAFREYGATTLRETGGFALWNPYLFGGLPFVAAMHGDIFYPVAVVLRWLLPTDVAMTFAFILHTILCGVFTYRFLRALGVGFWGSLVGGLAYMLSGPIASYPSPGHDGKLYVSAMLPLALLLLVRIIRDGRLWAIGALAITVGLATLSPHPQMLQYMLLAAGSFALLLAFADAAGAGLPRAVGLRRIGLALGGVALGMLCGAVQYLPVAQYAAWSPRAGGKGWEHAISYSMPPEELVNTYLPQMSGLLENYVGYNGIHFHSEYLVVVAMVLVGYAFGAAEPERRRHARFFLGLLVVSTLWALGGNTPFYRLVYAVVPGTKFFRAPSMILYVVAFAVSVLAALGLDRALRGAYKPRLLAGWAVVGALALVIALTGGWTNVAAKAGSRFGDLYEQAAANAGDVTLGAVRSLIFVVLTAAVLVALARGRLTARIAAIALTALVAVDGFSIAHHYWRFMGPADRIYASDPTIDYIRKQPQPGRVLALALDPQSTAPHDPMLSGDGLMSHRVRQVLGYHGNELGRYQVLYGKDDQMSNVANPRFWQLMNVRYLLVSGTQSPFAGAERLVGPVKNAAGSTVSLYAIPGDNPPAWVAPVMVKAPDDVVLSTLFDPRLDDVRRAALFDTSAAITPAQLRQLPPPSTISANVTRYDPGHISVRLSAPAPAGSALVVSENYYPGWEATANGKPAVVARANYVLTGVALPTGATEVDLTFHSAPYETGKVVTLVAMLASLALVVGGAFVDRRRLASA
jgi:Bacterial membrane protein YfhO